MLYAITVAMSEWISALNVFRFITFRSAVAVMFGMGICLILGPGLIKALRGDGVELLPPKERTQHNWPCKGLS